MSSGFKTEKMTFHMKNVTVFLCLLSNIDTIVCTGAVLTSIHNLRLRAKNGYNSVSRALFTQFLFNQRSVRGPGLK